MYHGHTSTVFAVAWSPDGPRIASESNDDTVQVRDATSGRQILTYGGQKAPLWAVAWSPSGECLASATGNLRYQRASETVQVWSATTGHLFSSYPLPSSTNDADGTLSVAWSLDSQHLAAAGADTVIRLWEIPGCTALYRRSVRD